MPSKSKSPSKKKPARAEVVEVDGAYGLARRGTLLETPNGRPLVHASRTLLRAVAKEIGSDESPDLSELSHYSMLCTLKDFVEPEREQDLSCRYLLLEEASLRRCAGPEVVEQFARLGFLGEYFDRHDLRLFSLSQSGDGEHQEQSLIESGTKGELDRVVAHFDRALADMTPAQHCAVTHCVHRHQVFVLAVLLVLGACTPEEYAEAVAAVHCVIPGVFGDVSKREAGRFLRGVEGDAEVVLGFADLAAVVG